MAYCRIDLLPVLLELRAPTSVSRRAEGGLALMIVPSFAAAGFGSIPAPGLYGANSPS